MSDLAHAFGQRIREVRKRKGISQDRLALMTDIDRSYMGRIERGEAQITLEKVYRLAKALDCLPQELLP